MDSALERPIVAADDEFRHALAMVGEHGQVNNATTVPPGRARCLVHGRWPVHGAGRCHHARRGVAGVLASVMRARDGRLDAL
jgi:hypothetical protein